MQYFIVLEKPRIAYAWVQYKKKQKVIYENQGQDLIELLGSYLLNDDIVGVVKESCPPSIESLKNLRDITDIILDLDKGTSTIDFGLRAFKIEVQEVFN